MKRYFVSSCAIKIVAISALLTSAVVFAEPQPLQLNDYLDQVLKTSPAVKASQLAIEGSKSSSKEGSLTFLPKFNFNANYIDDRREPQNPLYTGSTNSSSNLTFGIDQQFSFGTQAKLSYSIDNYKLVGTPSLLAPTGTFMYSAAQPQLEISQPLWRNFFGEESRATADLAEASSLATHYSERFKMKRTVADAESAYYRLAIARESQKLQEEVLDRSKKILDWSDRRVRNQLADKSDMLQAKAAFQMRQLEMETVKSDVRSAQLAFNTLRNSTADEVTETLAPVNTEMLLKIKAPKRAEVSDDLKAAEQNERVVRSNNELARQRVQPELALSGSLAYNGVDQYLSPAMGESFNGKHPRYTIGLRFTFPIFFWEAAEIRSGRTKQVLAAENATLQTRLDNAKTLDDLEKKFSEAKERLKLADELVKAQKEKLDHEKYRFNLGRTTTFQVLTYEQDYATSVISRLRIEQEMLAIHAQLKTYSEE